MIGRVVTGALFRSATEGMLWPAVPGRLGAELMAQLYQLEQTQYLPEQLLRTRQLQQLSLLAQHAAETTPFYRERFAALGVSTSPRSWQQFTELPLLTRRDLATRAAELLSTRLPKSHEPCHEVQTSGSTGEVVAVQRTAMSQLMWLALSMRDHLWHQRDYRKTLAVVRAHVPALSDDDAARSAGWGPPVSLLHETGPCYTLPLSTDVLELSAWLLAKAPEYLLIYPTALEALLQHWEASGTRPSRLSEVRTIGETLKPALRKRCQALLGARVVDSYSAQEVGAIALQCPESELYHVHAESLIVEVLDAQGRPAAAGQTGRVVVTDLHNFAMPLIRYELGDLAEVGAACPCGRGLPTLSRVLGRTRNLVVLPDGRRYWPLVGLHRFREVGGILQYQLVQLDLEQVELRLVVAAPLDPSAEARLGAIVREALGHDFRIGFRYFERELPGSRGGKFEEFVSRVE